MTPAFEMTPISEKKEKEELRTEVAHVPIKLPDGSEAVLRTSRPLIDGNERREEEGRLMRKVDIRLLPMVFLIFIMNYIDRIAVTAARLKGLEQDLGLSDIQYEVVVAIVYVSYCTAQIPSNMLINYVKRPSWYIGAFTVLWGLISTLTGITHNFGSIVACRILLGIPESAFYPGAMYLLSRWYTRKELAFRSAMLYGGLLISNAFGSLMAAGILSRMEGKNGIRGWRWLFFIEGGITMCIGLFAVWCLPDYPSDTRWLSQEEMRLAQARLAEDVGEADQDGTGESVWTGVKLACTDIKVSLFGALFCVELFGMSFLNFFPTLTSTLGFNSTISLLLAAPPWVLATSLCFLNCYHADKTGERFFHLATPLWGVIIGFIIAISTSSIGGRYFSMFLMASGYAVGSSLTVVWLSSTVPRPPAKRAAAIAIVTGIGNAGLALGTFAWKAVWGPAYHQTMFICIASLVLASSIAFTIRYILIRANKKLERDEMLELPGARKERIEEFARLEGITFNEALQRRKGFRYLY